MIYLLVRATGQNRAVSYENGSGEKPEESQTGDYEIKVSKGLVSFKGCTGRWLLGYQ